MLLGITFDKDLKFDDHVNTLCKKACQKHNAFTRLAPYINVEQRRIIIKAFIEPQFGYCPLIWMLHSRCINNKINRIHKRIHELLITTSHDLSKICLIKITLLQYTIETLELSP